MTQPTSKRGSQGAKMVVAFIEKNELRKSIIPLNWKPKEVSIWCRYPIGLVKESDLA